IPATDSGDGKMSPHRFATRFGAAEVVERAEQIDPEIWEKSFGRQCKDHRLYEVIEESLGEQFGYRYVIFTNERTGEQAVQPFLIVTQDLTAGLPRKLRSAVAGIRKKFPRFLNMKILMVGCAAGEGHFGSTEKWAIAALHEFLPDFARVAKTSIILLK